MTMSRRKPVTPAAAKPSRAPQPVWFWGLLGLIAWVPFPFASNRPWSSDLLGLVAGVLLLLCARDIYRRDSFWPVGAPWRRIGCAAAIILALIVWGFAQTVGWPAAAPPIWDRASHILASHLTPSISLTPDLFGECVLRIFGYAAIFLLAFFGGRDIDRARLLLKTFAYTGAIYAFYGLLVQSSGVNFVLWYPKWAYWNDLTSTFVNKNSYATYAGLGLISCLALLWRQLSMRRQAFRLSIIALERIGWRDLVIPCLCLLLFGALLLTGSRGGVTSSFFGCLAFMGALAVNQGWTGRKWLWVLLPAAVFLTGFAMFSADMFLDSINPTVVEDNSQLRLGAYETISRALSDNPWLGYGLGGFESAFRLYRDSSIHEWFEHAHNDYLELAMEVGIPATVLYVGSIAGLASCCFIGAGQRRKHESYCLLAVGATVLVALHSLVDFSMEIPAVASTYSAILGLGVAQSWSSRDFADSRDEPAV